MSSELKLLAPLSGWIAPLAEVPDEVFASGMMGDGIAIDPTGNTLHAPCDGRLIVVPVSRHAVTLRHESGVEILLHVGIDTVALAGEGFELHVREGQDVRAGDRLISFDLELLAQRAKSLLTPCVITNTDRFAILTRVLGRAAVVGEEILELAPADAIAAVGQPTSFVPGLVPESGSHASREPLAPEGSVQRLKQELPVELEHGLHARPAAMIAAAMKSVNADVILSARGRRANAKSPTAIMSLGARKGDVLIVEVTGPEAPRAVSSLERILAAAKATVERPQPILSSPTRLESTTRAENALPGVVASRGLAIGCAFQYFRATVEAAEAGRDPAFESAELDRARALVKAELQRALSSASHDSAGAAAREVAAAHLELLDDPELLAGAKGGIAAGQSAGFAWRAALQSAIGTLRGLEDARMAERADDLLDLESRVLLALSGRGAVAPELPQGAIVLANELLPSQLTALDTNRIAGICLAAGGPTSHVAIIAAAMDIPALVAGGPRVMSIPTGTWLVLDAEAGWLHLDPPESQLRAFRDRAATRRERRTAELAAARADCFTADGMRIEVFANIGSLAEARAAVRNGAEGCGLLRTEFLFLDREQPPSESEQAQLYQQIADELDGRPLTVRTMDVGGDKPIPYLELPHEDNPALGLRGLRTSLWRPDLLQVQLRAILRVRPSSQCRILLPMVTDASEIRAVRGMLDELRPQLASGAAPEPIMLGAMIETPAAALMAERIAREVGLLSLGTNDLTQYTLAMDRTHANLAARLDGLHPAVLRLIEQTARATRAGRCLLAVCGGLASDPIAVPILIGLGVQELSVLPGLVSQSKALIRTLTVSACRELAEQALQLESAEAVREQSLQRLPALQELQPLRAQESLQPRGTQPELRPLPTQHEPPAADPSRMQQLKEPQQ